jgi:hypothetical protein
MERLRDELKYRLALVSIAARYGASRTLGREDA